MAVFYFVRCLSGLPIASLFGMLLDLPQTDQQIVMSAQLDFFHTLKSFEATITDSTYAETFP